MNINDKIINVFVSELIEKATYSEQLFKQILEDNKIRYKFQHPILYKNSFIICDFYIKSINMIIEIDGGYHFTKEQRLKDTDRDVFLKQNGYKIERIPNDDVTKYDLRNITKHFGKFKTKKRKKKPVIPKKDCEIKKKEPKISKKNLLLKRENMLRLQYPYLFK
jgi:very-short-patch-repair endonuclease